MCRRSWRSSTSTTTTRTRTRTTDILLTPKKGGPSVTNAVRDALEKLKPGDLFPVADGDAAFRAALPEARKGRGLAPVLVGLDLIVLPDEPAIVEMAADVSRGCVAAGAMLHDFLLDRGIPLPASLCEARAVAQKKIDGEM